MQGDEAARPGPDELSLLDAARLLGVSAEALRKRVQRGKTMAGRKWRGEWYILRAVVEAELGQPDTGRVLTRQDAPSAGTSEDVLPGQDTAGPSGQDAVGHVQTGPDDSGRVDMLERENALLREMLDRERLRADQSAAAFANEQQASAELRRLLAVTMQTRALSAPADDEAPPGAPESPPRVPAPHSAPLTLRRILRDLRRFLST